MNQKFSHLHVHTDYSILDGIIPVEQLCRTVKKMGMKSVSITDHGNLFGSVKFYQSAIENGIKPVIGCEVYLAPRRMTDKNKDLDDTYYHLILLAKNQEGYKNLIKLVSASYLYGFYYKPKIDKEILFQHRKGLIALSACVVGEVPTLLLRGRYKEAKEAAQWYLSVFGEGNFFLELNNHGLEDQQKVLEIMPTLSLELSIPLVVTNDVHYLHKEDAYTQDIMLCIQQSKTLSDGKRLSFDVPEFYLKSPETMYSEFSSYQDALNITNTISENCNAELEFGKILLPKFDLPEGKSDNDMLEELTLEGLKQKYPAITEGIKNRALTELKLIKQMGFASYFLIVWDLIQYARSNGIAVGPGRGSVAGSIVAYALNITKVDPLSYDLLFERFLNPERISMPDIDMDFCDTRRNEMIEYAKRKYGEDKVAQIITFGREGAKQAIRDVARVLEIPLSEASKVANLIPSAIPGSTEKNVTIKNSIEYVEELSNLWKENPTIRKLLEISMKVEGLARNISTHAAGIVISNIPLTDSIALYKSPSEDVVTTQLTYEDLEKLGLMKMDFLGLKTLTIVEDTIRFIKARTDILLNIDEIPHNDKKTFTLFSNGDTEGIFQFESSGIRKYLRQMSPRNLEDLIALNALYRPGTLGAGMVDEYMNRRSGKSKVEYLHPKLEPILRDTKGVIVYQEQVMLIANIIAGLSLAQADNIRRGMGKKKKEEITKYHDDFIKGAAANGVSEEIAQEIFQLMVKFAGYGFNKSHSAAYAYLAYQTGYLKANYPVEFMAALLKSVMGDTTKIASYVEDCRRMGIKILPPDVNSSYPDFRPLRESISYGLVAIKNVGGNAAEVIVQDREISGKPFLTIFDLCKRVDVKALNIKTLESLIRAGAFDSMPGNRAQKITILEQAIEFGKNFQKNKDKGQISLFDMFNDSGETQVSLDEPSLPFVEEFDAEKLITDENEYLGFYLLNHPLERHRQWIEKNSNIKCVDLVNLEFLKKTVKVAGIINWIRESFSQKLGDQVLTLELEDLTGKVVVTFHSKERTRYFDILKAHKIVSIVGRVWFKQKDKSDEEENFDARLTGSEVISLDEEKKPKIPPRAKSDYKMHIKLTSEMEKVSLTMENLEKLFFAYKGQSSVIVHIKENNTDERNFILKNYKVNISTDMLRIAHNIIGKENVWVE